ncbi:hypothetical protein [Rosistilla oblonga]|uniref:hypothetical protein n=1 Tax=Rosistilla oblonga TaxID=2527990 RepID=UPI003A96D0CE
MSEEGKFLGVSITIWEGIQGVLAVVGAVLAIGGIFWGVIEFRGKLEADRARETLELLDVWETRGYLESYRALDDRIQGVLKDVPQADIEAAAQNPSILETLYQKASEQVLADPRAQKDFEDVVYFFERMHICVDAKLCAQEATARFFADTVTTFGQVFSVPLQKFPGGAPEFYSST